MHKLPAQKEMPSWAIEVIALTHRYDAFVAVDHISFKVQTGTTFGLIGPNGAGKSTTLRMLTTLLPTTSGNAFIKGYSLIDQPELVRQSIGYVPQLLSADGDLTGYENLLLSAKLYGIPRGERKVRIQEVIDFMSLNEVTDKLVHDYSGGMIRRLEIAQSLIHRPSVLFLDEPSVGLDPAARRNMWKHIHELRRLGTTILMTTHDMDEADALCDIVAFMHMGQLVIMDTPQNLKASLGPKATLDDVFIVHTGSSLKEKGEYSHVKETRSTIAHL